MYQLSNFGGHGSYEGEDTGHLSYEHLEGSWAHRLGPPHWRALFIFLSELVDVSKRTVFNCYSKLYLLSEAATGGVL